MDGWVDRQMTVSKVGIRAREIKLHPPPRVVLRTACGAHVCHVHAQPCLTLCDPVDCTLQAPLSVGFLRQEHWSGSPCPPPGDLPDQGLNLCLLCPLPGQVHPLPLSHQGRWSMWSSSHVIISYSLANNVDDRCLVMIILLTILMMHIVI